MSEDPCSVEAQQPNGPYIAGTKEKPAPIYQCHTDDDTDRFDYYVQEAFPKEEWDKAIRVRWCESRNDPNAVGWAANEHGLFQIHPGWYNGVWNPGFSPAFDAFDPWLNTKFAAKLQEEISWAQWTCARNLGIR